MDQDLNVPVTLLNKTGQVVKMDLGPRGGSPVFAVGSASLAAAIIRNIR